VEPPLIVFDMFGCFRQVYCTERVNVVMATYKDEVLAARTFALLGPRKQIVFAAVCAG